jgi:hypothetical protein
MSVQDLPVFPSDILRIVCISDTHGDDPTTSIPPGDIFIHAGDMGGKDKGTAEEMKTAYEWISSLPHRVKIVVSGKTL